MLIQRCQSAACTVQNKSSRQLFALGNIIIYRPPLPVMACSERNIMKNRRANDNLRLAYFKISLLPEGVAVALTVALLIGVARSRIFIEYVQMSAPAYCKSGLSISWHEYAYICHDSMTQHDIMRALFTPAPILGTLLCLIVGSQIAVIAALLTPGIAQWLPLRLIRILVFGITGAIAVPLAKHFWLYKAPRELPIDLLAGVLIGLSVQNLIFRARRRANSTERDILATGLREIAWMTGATMVTTIVNDSQWQAFWPVLRIVFLTSCFATILIYLGTCALTRTKSIVVLDGLKS